MQEEIHAAGPFLPQSSFRNPAQQRAFPWSEDLTMRKAVSRLDEDQRSALFELADLGTAVFSAGLIVAVLQGLVSLVT
jgi:hypothetical protein